MPLWLTKFGPALFALLKKGISSLALFAAYVSGRRSQREADQREAIDALQKGADAGSAVKHDHDSIMRDPLNRD